MKLSTSQVEAIAFKVRDKRVSEKSAEKNSFKESQANIDESIRIFNIISSLPECFRPRYNSSDDVLYKMANNEIENYHESIDSIKREITLLTIESSSISELSESLGI